ncbi:MAG TPA: PAS domain-containing sensor histidine kinase, partial [Myxococcota bacterium]|nr:PAS domain-containing sensor histidine kinase [Myxococcota bacterium]
TSRRRAEQALRESERQLRGILEATQDAILVTDAAGGLVFVNPPMRRLAGCEVGPPLAEQAPAVASWRISLPGGDVRPFGDLCARAAEELRVPITGLELEVPERDSGALETFSVSVAPLGPRGAGAVVVAHDVTLRAEVERMKSEFLQTAAHELRTPLTALQIGLDRCQRRLTRGKPIHAAILARMNVQTGRLTDIMNTLVEVAQLDTGGPIQELRVVNMTQLVGDVVRRQRLQAPGRELVLSSAGHSCYTMSDASSIERVLGNLIDNAVRYSEGTVQITVSADTRAIHVAVTDAGPGIPRRHWQRLFTQMPGMAERTDSRQGLGVNLYVCRRLIHALGGTIDADAPPDGGTRFSFTLPAWTATPDAAGPASAPPSEPRRAVPEGSEAACTSPEA